MSNPLQKIIQAVAHAMASSPVRVDVPSEWLAPISPEAPSGPWLEYDPEYAVLAARLAPRADVQYGRFKNSAAEPEWTDIERDARRLMLRSKDITVLIWWARCRTHQAGAGGLLQGLSALQQVCERFGDSLHPQLVIEGDHDPLVRANALAALCDPEGLLDDVRNIVIVGSSAQRLTVRDVERALAVPRLPTAPEPEAVQRQLQDLHQRRDPQLLTLQACAACVHYLQAWVDRQLRDEAPSLQALSRLLQPLLMGDPPLLPVPGCLDPAASTAKPAATADPAPPVAPAPPVGPPPQDGPPPIEGIAATLPAAGFNASASPQSREQVRAALAQVRAWVETHEPSSPVAVLIKQAERMWGKRFSEVAHMIPAELLRAWDQDD